MCVTWDKYVEHVRYMASWTFICAHIWRCNQCGFTYLRLISWGPANELSTSLSIWSWGSAKYNTYVDVHINWHTAAAATIQPLYHIIYGPSLPITVHVNMILNELDVRAWFMCVWVCKIMRWIYGWEYNAL